jgi:hypothetical protein
VNDVHVGMSIKTIAWLTFKYGSEIRCLFLIIWRIFGANERL